LLGERARTGPAIHSHVKCPPGRAVDHLPLTETRDAQVSALEKYRSGVRVAIMACAFEVVCTRLVRMRKLQDSGQSARAGPQPCVPRLNADKSEGVQARWEGCARPASARGGGGGTPILRRHSEANPTGRGSQAAPVGPAAAEAHGRQGASRPAVMFYLRRRSKVLATTMNYLGGQTFLETAIS
jgi:hypothetical protein